MNLRLSGLVRKEFLQIVRDPSSIAIAFLMPLVLLLLFGYGVSLDSEHVPIGVVVEHPDADSSGFASAFPESLYFRVTDFRSRQEAENAMVAGKISAILVLKGDFSRKLKAGSTPVELILNGVDENTARIISGYVDGAFQKWQEHDANLKGLQLQTPVQLEQRIWYNSEVRSRNFLVPGLIAVIMTLIGALLTALVMAREWERGTMEALLVTPISMQEVILGKLIPYFLLGMGGLSLSVAMAIFLFEVPLRGSLWVLFATSALFLVTALSMGLLISSVAKNQFVAGQVAIIGTFLPAFILSGFIFDINSMPPVVQLITHAIAARYYVTILQTVFLVGDEWSVILPNAASLVLLAAFFLGLTWKNTRKRLE